MAHTTRVLFRDEAKAKVLKGIDILADAVGMSLGPRSSIVGMVQQFPNGISVYKVNKDGYSIAKSIHLEDPFEAFGVNVVREAAQKTVDTTGDGTSVTIILAHALIHACQRAINNGENPMSLARPLTESVEKMCSQLDKMAIPIKTLDQKTNIATISANGDKELGELIARTLHSIGQDGVLTIQESKKLKTEVTKQEGMQFDTGWAHPLFMTNQDRRTADLDNVPVLITDKYLNDPQELATFLNIINPHTGKLVIIAPDYSPEVLGMLLEAKMKGEFLSLAIKAPGMNQNQRDILHDLCALTGATYISTDAKQNLKDVTFEALGKISRISVTTNATVITQDNPNNEALKSRVASIKVQLSDETITDFDRKKLQERLGKLTNGIAVLNIGGATQVEMEETKERAMDAVGATKAAIRDGIISGGETAYLPLRLVNPKSVTDQILNEVLEAPFMKLMENAGFNGEIKLYELGIDIDVFGIDVTDGMLKAMVEAGIIDPVAVPKAALRNALSVAIPIIELGVVIVPAEEKK